MTRFRFVSEHMAEYPVKRLCELVECSRSGFYAWRNRPLSDHYLADVDLAAEIFEIHATRNSKIANGEKWHSDVSCDAEPPQATRPRLSVSDTNVEITVAAAIVSANWR